METIEITLIQYLDLLECKLMLLNNAKDDDPTWNYNTEELEKTIESVKSKL